MNSPILNRDFSHPADGWYQIEPRGEHPNRAAGVVQVIDDAAMKSIVERFNQDAAAGKLRHGNEMLIDHEHFSDQADKESRAYGWLVELQVRADGIYGRVRWSKTGKEAVDGGDYRFFSTEYEAKECEALGNIEHPTSNIEHRIEDPSALPHVRPLRLGGLTLTNMNNNRGQKPITNRGDSGTGILPVRTEQETHGQDARATNSNQTKHMNTVAIKLGLAGDVSEEIILAEVSRLLNRVTDMIPHEEENKSLRDRLGAIDGEQVHTLLDLHGVRDEKIRNRLKPVLMGLKNREERVAALLDFGFKPEERRANDRQPPRLLNRGEGRAARVEIIHLNEQALAERAEAEIGDYKIRNRCTYAEARNAVRVAKPELFGLEKK
jgi:Mu-like prophage I protein